MSLASLAERMAADPPRVALDTQRCVRSRDRLSQCELCVRACPVNAIRLDPAISVDAERCNACGACLPVCPVGAITGNDSAADLVKCLARLPDASVVELGCARHPQMEYGSSAPTAVVRVEQCLAALGPSVYIWLLAGQTRRIMVRTDACAKCPIGTTKSQIERTLAAAQRLVPSGGERIVRLDHYDASWKPRPIVNAKNPPLSRRELFTMFTQGAPKPGTQVLPFVENQTTAATSLTLERRRLLYALARLAPSAKQNLSSELMEGLNGIRLSVNEKCSACGVCARICPTKAIELSAQDSDFRLTFWSRSCTDCGMCLDVCQPKALERAGTLSLAEFLASEPVLLRSGALRKCQKCGAKFAGETGDLCYVCDSQQQNAIANWWPTEPTTRE